MHGICKERCKNNLEYPVKDVIYKRMKLWEQKGFIRCTNCEIYISKEKYLHEVRCRCCNGVFRLKPKVIKRKGPRIIDYSKRYCIECGSTTTYISKQNGKPRPRWYKFLDGFSCANCSGKRIYAIRKLREKEMVIYNR